MRASSGGPAACIASTAWSTRSGRPRLTRKLGRLLAMQHRNERLDVICLVEPSLDELAVQRLSSLSIWRPAPLKLDDALGVPCIGVTMTSLGQELVDGRVGTARVHQDVDQSECDAWLRVRVLDAGFRVGVVLLSRPQRDHDCE